MDAITKPQRGIQERRKITPADVKAAVARATAPKEQNGVFGDSGPAGSDLIFDLNDISQPYLTLRQRGRSVGWLVRAYGRTKKIGSATGSDIDPTYLSLRDAREKAKQIYGDLAARRGEPPAPDPSPAPRTWTWADLDREYQAMIAKPRWISGRMKPASSGTCDDVRLAFAKPSFTALHAKQLTELDRPVLNGARDEIASFRQRQKNCAYFKAAMTWAADKKPDESGLVEGVDRWWERLTAGEPSTDQMLAITARQTQHLDRKSALDVESIGAMLARHEEYCCGRTAEEKISPGIRFGLWWVCFTANRRFSTVKLKREDLLTRDPLSEEGFGRAMWPADTMKAKVPFWLPLPSAVVDVAKGSIADYTALVKRSHGDWPSAWVFASTRRHGRDEDNDDVSVYPNSLNRHLQRMRAANALDGLPYFSLHLARSVMGDFIHDKVSPVASSLVLAHTLPTTADEASTTTREFYLTSQRMAEKTAAMKAWSETLIEAYLKSGGKMPAGSEGPLVKNRKRLP